MADDLRRHTDLADALCHNFHERWRIWRAARRHYILCALTLGLYALFVAKPTEQLREIPDVGSIPFSGIFLFGTQHVFIGIHELIEREFLLWVKREWKEGEGEKTLDVFFPTAELVSLIMQKQGVAK